MKRKPQTGEVWYAWLPKEENKHDLMERPCIIVDQIENEYLVIKVTKHDPRPSDPYDREIINWNQCGLKRKSTARVSKIIPIKDSQIDNYKGKLTTLDELRITKALEQFIEQSQ